LIAAVKRLAILILMFSPLMLAIPWIFVGSARAETIGLPTWVVYSGGVAVFFPVLAAYLLGRFWKRFEGESDDPRDWP